MNNYCTNCGRKLDEGEKICPDCKVEVVLEPKEKKKMIKSVLIITGVLILCFIGFSIAKEKIDKIKVKKLQKDYVEPYLKKHYRNVSYAIEYDSTGKCIISGNCEFDAAMGCDGGACEPYEYLSDKECRSYYYSVKMRKKTCIVTVVYKDKQYTVVEGKNIYEKSDKKEV